eukprot:Skav209744  [mRNA]  locus=scaffold2057:70401:75405:- [translate_table: standard]
MVTTWFGLIAWSIWHWGIFGMGGKTFLIPLFVWIPTGVFFVVIFFGHHVWPRSHMDWWLDKLCIHQTREKLKEQGDYDEPLHAFNTFVRKELSKVVEQKVIGANVYHIRYRRNQF